MARKRYHVVPNGSDWKLNQEGSSMSLFSHPTKSVVVDKGRQVAQANHPSQLIIHTQDGRIETEHTYGKDPYPPPG
jgi:hypothetical protein